MFKDLLICEFIMSLAYSFQFLFSSFFLEMWHEVKNRHKSNIVEWSYISYLKMLYPFSDSLMAYNVFPSDVTFIS